jgi:hypothetical protein
MWIRVQWWVILKKMITFYVPGQIVLKAERQEAS